MERFEVIVIGGGPAGAVAARTLAAAGARVVLVDGSHPREKACGGGVTGRALALLGLSGSGRSVARVRFESGEAAVAVDLPAGFLDVVSREQFDGALLALAERQGVQRVQARATAIEPTRDGWIVSAGARRLAGRWILGADGAGGITRKQLWRPFTRAQLSIAAGSYVDGPDVSEIVIRFVDAPRGYLWSFPRPGHLAVGTCAQADVTSTAEMHAVTEAWLDRYAPAAGLPRRRYAWPIPSLDAAAVERERPAADGWMLLGDAAALVDPITREGIFFAIRSGMMAATALAGPDPARDYAAQVRDELHDELRRAAVFKAGFFRPRFTRLLVDAVRESAGVRAVMIDLIAGRQSYRGLKRRLLGTLEVGLAVRALLGR